MTTSRTELANRLARDANDLVRNHRRDDRLKVIYSAWQNAEDTDDVADSKWREDRGYEDTEDAIAGVIINTVAAILEDQQSYEVKLTKRQREWFKRRGI